MRENRYPLAIYISKGKEDNQPMGKKTARKMLSVLIALVMIMTSGIAVFAAGGSAKTAVPSTGGGNQNPPRVSNLGTSDSYMNKWFNHKYSGYNVDYFIDQMRTRGGSWQEARTRANSPHKMWSGLKDGGLYEFRVIGVNKYGRATSPIAYRWMKSVKANAKCNKAGQFTINWQKVSGATTYQIEYSKSRSMSSPKYAYASSGSTSKTVSASKGTWYYRIRPVKKSGNSYVGIYNGIQAVTVR